MQISLDQAAEWLQKYYGVTGEISSLPGEVDYNFKVKTTAQKRFIFKISHAEESVSVLEFQLALLGKIAAAELQIAVPHLLPNLEGEDFSLHTTPDGKKFNLRLHSWVSGRDIANFQPHHPELLQAWGAAMGELTKALEGFDHPEAHQFLKWDLAQVKFSEQFLPELKDEKQKEIAGHYFARQENSKSQLAPLRKGVVHNDGNDYNIMVNLSGQETSLSGVIDFGDAIYTQLINDVAIGAAYVGMGKQDPLEAICHFVAGYHSTFPLLPEELAVLYDQIAARLLITVTNAAHNRTAHPDNEYLSISEAPAWEILEKWKNINPDFAHYSFRAACGLAAHPQQQNFEKWCEENQELFADIINTTDKAILPLDLSIGSPALGNFENYFSNDKFEKCLSNLLPDEMHQIGFGGYGENRPFYTSDTFRQTKNEGHCWRSKHLGLDLWTPYRTQLYAFYSGVVHRLFNNVGNGNYGPTVILQHSWKHGHFYSLHGHLSMSTIESLEVGQQVSTGDLLGSIGGATENGNWPAHLHFQLMLNLFDFENDFPGVASPTEEKVWLSNSPDPAFLFPQYKSDSLKINPNELINKRKQKLGKNLSLSYSEPLTIVRGQGQYLINPEGQKYLDTVNNVAHVGHEHPRVIRAAHQQNSLLNTNTRYLHPNIINYAEKLLSKFPAEYEICYFVNSGSEANELAMRMCDAWSGGEDMIAVEVGYHGNTKRCIEVSSYKFDGKGGQGRPGNTQILPIPDTFRGLYRGQTEVSSEKYASHLKQALKSIEDRGGKLAGFIGESILSCGGQIVLPPDYLAKVYAQIRAAGGLCIADEVQVGFGRVGKHYWGFELQDVKPDIVTLGKPIGNGHPLGAVVTTRAVAERFNNGMEFFNTFGGNPVSCAIGNEVLQIIEDEKLQERALEFGQYLKAELNKLKAEFPLIGDVRGHGLFLGIELVRDIDQLTPADWECAYVADRMKQQGILMSTDGPYHNVLKIKPPMCIEKNDLDYMLERLKLVLKDSVLNI